MYRKDCIVPKFYVNGIEVTIDSKFYSVDYAKGFLCAWNTEEEFHVAYDASVNLWSIGYKGIVSTLERDSEGNFENAYYSYDPTLFTAMLHMIAALKQHPDLLEEARLAQLQHQRRAHKEKLEELQAELTRIKRLIESTQASLQRIEAKIKRREVE